MTPELSILAARMAALDTPGRPQAAPMRPASLPAVQPAENRLALSLREAAAMIGVHPKTLAKWPLPFIRLGRVVRVRREDLDTFLRAHATIPPSTSQEKPDGFPHN